MTTAATNETAHRQVQSPPPGGSLLTPSESARCPSCESEIPQQNIARNLVTDYSGQGRKQRVRAWCDHCSVLYQLERIDRNGYWEPLGKVTIVTDARQRESFQRRLDHLRGNIQTSPSARGK